MQKLKKSWKNYLSRSLTAVQCCYLRTWSEERDKNVIMNAHCYASTLSPIKLTNLTRTSGMDHLYKQQPAFLLFLKILVPFYLIGMVNGALLWWVG